MEKDVQDSTGRYDILQLIDFILFFIWLIDWLTSPFDNISSSTDGVTDTRKNDPSATLPEPDSILPDITNSVCSSTSSLSTPVLPSSATNWPGQYNFKIIVHTNTEGGQRDPHYSPKVNKLYTSRNQDVLIQVTTDHTLGAPGGPLLKISMIYTAPDYSAEPVKVCYTHCIDSLGKQAILGNF